MGGMDSNVLQRIVLIAGPTASGKSALALGIAQHLGGVVVNADSMQVYRDLEVLTARPRTEDLTKVRHVLYGHIDGAEAYSVGRWLDDMRAVLAELRREGAVPVIVGGTGLYFKALTEGLAPIPPVPAEIRDRWRRAVAERGAHAMHVELKQRDPETAAQLNPTDAQRLTRALEVLEATGRGLATWQRLPGQPLVDPEQAVRLVLGMDREALYAGAEARFDRMLADGALDEIRRLVARGLSPDLPVMRALGVGPLARHLEGKIGLEAAANASKTETRQYIKRQLTWLKRNMITWKLLHTKEIERIKLDHFTLIRS